MNQPKLFKYRHYQAETILLCVRWYLRYSLSYRDLEEMMVERGLAVDHTTIYRWVQHYAPILEKKCRAKLRPTNHSWRVDETYVKVKGVWMYLYRAVDSAGNTVEFMLSPTRNAQAAKRFFRKALRARHTVPPRVINVGSVATTDEKANWVPGLVGKSAGRTHDIVGQPIVATLPSSRPIQLLQHYLPVYPRSNMGGIIAIPPQSGTSTYIDSCAHPFSALVGSSSII